MEKEFNLSEKEQIRYNDDKYRDGCVYTRKDVKEFIERLKEEMGLDVDNCECCKTWFSKIDELVGDKLK